MSETYTIHGLSAIDLAERQGLTLHAHTSPVEDGGIVTLDKAREIAREDANLIYVRVQYLTGLPLGYNLENYFRRVGLALTYLGPDEDGIEPRFVDAPEREAKRPSNLPEFLSGFGDITGGDRNSADEDWAAFSRQLPDAERERIEAGGFVSGQAEGRRFMAEFPVLPRRYRMSDGVSDDTVDADSIEAAMEKAREWLLDGEWGSTPKYVEAEVWEVNDNGERINGDVRTVEVLVGQTPEPDCEGVDGTEGQHDWQNPHSLVGGIADNPGVWALRGTQLSLKNVCARCGMFRTTITESTPGDHPKTPRVDRYESASEESAAWARGQQGVAL